MRLVHGNHNSHLNKLTEVVCNYLIEEIESKKILQSMSKLPADTCINVFKRGYYVRFDIDTNFLNCTSMINQIPTIKNVIQKELHVREDQIYFKGNSSQFSCQTQMMIVQLENETRASIVSSQIAGNHTKAM